VQQAGLVRRTAVIQPEGHAVWRRPRDERDARVGFLPAEGHVVAGIAEGLRRKCLVGGLGLLNGQHIRAHTPQPLDGLVQARTD